MSKAIGYIRVSTMEQAKDDKFGEEAQKEAIEKYAFEHGYEIVNWVKDEESGADRTRPGIHSILDNVTNPPIHAVICFKGDRIARDHKFYFWFWYELDKREIKLLSVMDLDVPEQLATLYQSILQYVAEQERLSIAIRTGAGRKIKAKCGGYAGGGVPYGYKVEKGRLVIDEEEKKIVEMIFREWIHGTSMQDTAEYLNDLKFKTRKGKRFYASTIKGVLEKKKFYEGYYKYGDMNEWVEGIHEPILK